MKKSAFVSIDFDFFVRELPEWDWQHAENMIYYEMLWPTRYTQDRDMFGRRLDVLADTDIDEYADFDPADWQFELTCKGLAFRNEFRLGTADSHLAILDSMKGLAAPPDLLINLDAHHDLFGEPGPSGPDCGNWGTTLVDRWPDMKFVWLYPNWSEGPEWYSERAREIEVEPWGTWEPDDGYEIVGVFLCRSSCWVPPHLDPRFNEMMPPDAEALKLPVRKYDEKEIAAYAAQVAAVRESQIKELKGS